MAKLRVCADCPTIIPAGTRSGRCPQHERQQDRKRGTSRERGYGTQHQKTRATYQTQMEDGKTFQCWRCGNPIDPTAWDLGHDDHDRSTYRGPECVKCNRATSTRR